MTAAPIVDPFAALNDGQRAAVEHGIGEARPAPLLVIAGAGSGKTMTLAARAARLVLAGTDPQRLLLMTFSRRAAQEMSRRVGRVLHQALGWPAGQPAPALQWSGTFHAVGARLLREAAPQVGLPEDFTVHDRGDAESLMGLARSAAGLADRRQRFPMPATCLAIYSRLVNAQAPLPEVLATRFPWCATWEAELRALFRAYVEEKQRQHALDLDDLLLYWQQMLEVPAIAAVLRTRFDHVLVDEYQDTNRLQAAILHGLRPEGTGLTVVGDDAQSIYSFRAAEVRNILDFPRAFDPPARVLTLERNYRSTQPILAASNAVIAQAPERFAKTLWSDTPSAERPALVTVDDEAAQAQWVADEVLRRREGGLALKSQAVLFRASHHSAALELELTRRQIPFVKFGGLKFLEAAHVKDVLALLRWAQNPRSRLAAARVAPLVPGLGPASVRRILEMIAAADDPVQGLHDWRAPAAAATDWAALLALLGELRPGAWPDDLPRAIAWYRPQLERLHEDAAVRAIDLETLRRLAASHGSRERFLTELTLDPPEATSAEAGEPLRDEDYLILSTMHSAKGQEWTAVYLLNVVDGCIPSDMATGMAEEIEEERRLLYVAMTRARRHLQLVVPQRFHVTQQRAYGDRHLYGGLTRFIPEALHECFEGREPARAASVAPLAWPAAPEAGDGASSSIADRVRALF